MSGSRAIKARIRLLHSSRSRSTTLMPCDSMKSLAPANVSDSPTMTRLTPNWTAAPRAEVAGHQRGVERRVAVEADPPGVAQAVDLGVKDRAAFLHPLVVSRPQHPIAADQHGADGDAAFRQTPPRLVDRQPHVSIQSLHCQVLPPVASRFRIGPFSRPALISTGAESGRRRRRRPRPTQSRCPCRRAG